ncbi:DUF2637 domain-containing protein [Streptomyces sp. WMMB303]|uniref:DUF2637 domain-containing protein n=1 Tax=Streptomyces sp. WMMB303 TaxID=3034154 RepID=UPI0023EB97CC|nr:DUF2637 domain-containing protein [Streptomyces sp. WMMB303]MDF4250443.1 DUF2637 domain-containing protein [Streptomyces sp. WMMB303]
MSVDLTKSPAPGTAGVPALSKQERGLLAAVAVFAVGVGGLGLASSFDAVQGAAVRWGFGQPWMLPVGIDVAIPVFTAANLLLIRVNMPLGWVRFVPWALTAVTCWLNVAAGHTLSARLAHGTMPLLWVVLSEVAAHVYASRIGAVTGARMERIRRSRWLLAFPSTFALWRRMVLWEVTSYSAALERERERQLARAELREEYGRRWRRKAPRRTRVMLKLGELAPHDTAPAPAELPAQETAPEPVAPEPTPEPVKQPTRRRPAKKSKPNKAPRLSFEELLEKAREITAEWPFERLEAAPIREAVGCGQTRSRELREALKAERREQGPAGVAA